VLFYVVRARNADGSTASLNPETLQRNLTTLANKLPYVVVIEIGFGRDAKGEPPNDPHFNAKGSWEEDYPDQWALQRVGFSADPATSAWSGLDADRARPCTVAVIGTGVDWGHPELWGQMWINMKEDPYNGRDDDGNGYVDDQFGWNFRENNPDVMDRGGHDTHVAGVIAARTDNGRGIAGVNPWARIMALKVANHAGQANSVDVTRAIFYAIDHGARVVNISYGGKRFSQIEQAAIAEARGRGVLVVVAAGNEAADAKQLALASARGVLTVAGTTVEDKRVRFSNWGQVVDLSAPAMDVLSLRARGTDFLLYTGENPNYEGGRAIVGSDRDLYRASGTSFAAPFVSGVASLLFSTRPELNGQQVERMLLMSCRDVEKPGWDQYTGQGLLDARKALAADPDYFLLARITGFRPVRRDNQVFIEVLGQADASALTGRWLQVAFGENPARDDWKTVEFKREPQPGGVLGAIPATSFTRGGTWSVRILVQHQDKTVRQALGTIKLN
jgi:subtilisin family serine protease